MPSNAAGATVKPVGSVLFVCLGNICRSPLAEGILRAVLAEAGQARRHVVDSAGTGAWHVGDGPDPRSVAIAAAHGIDISRQRARQVAAADFQRFDLILAMDRFNASTLRARAPAAAHSRIHLFMDYALGIGGDVPDPYHGGHDGFEAVYQMLRQGCASLAEKLADGREAVSG